MIDWLIESDAMKIGAIEFREAVRGGKDRYFTTEEGLEHGAGTKIKTTMQWAYERKNT